jgi:hypothetical protein
MLVCVAVRVAVRMAVIVAVIVRMILRVLFEMLVVMLVAVIVATSASTAAASLFLMRRVILRFQIEHFMMMLVGVIMPAAASMVVMVIVPMIMRVMIMAMTMTVVMAVIMTMMLVSATLWLEGTLHYCHRAAQTAQHFNEHMIVLDINGFGRYFGRRMAVADMPCGLHQARGIFGADFDEFLRRSLDEDEAPIFELQRVAIVEYRGLVEIEKKRRALFAGQRDTTAMTAFMIERNRVDHLLGFHGRFADSLNGTQHRGPLQQSLLFKGLAEGMPALRPCASVAPCG